MSIVITPGKRETAEVEFAGRHPDVFCTHLAAELVYRLAAKTNDTQGHLSDFRSDLTVQALGLPKLKNGVTGIWINIGGQITAAQSISIREIAQETALQKLAEAGYFEDGDFAQKEVTVDTQGIIRQSPNLTEITYQNKFADTTIVFGHYIAPPFGLEGTFPSLVIAKKVDAAIAALAQDMPEIRNDGKVHVTIRYTKDGFLVEEVYASVAHQKNPPKDFAEKIRSGITKALGPTIENAAIRVNAGGPFDVYFLQADSGISKIKDSVIITGGITALGTDAVWGKCLFKPSSILVPYAFVLSRTVCDATGARYASVQAFARYGQKEVELQLEDIDPLFEDKRDRLNKVLKRLPRDRDSIYGILGMGISLSSYKMLNDVGGFHSADRPWKKENPNLLQFFAKYG